MDTSIRPLSFVLALLTALIAACSPVHEGVRTSEVTPLSAGKVRPNGSIEVPQTPMRSAWKPSSARLSCPQGLCPAGVGVLLFAGPGNGATVPLMRCTAFLISSDQIASNGHCDFFSTHAGYFVFRNSKGDTEFREVVSVLAKAFTDNPDTQQKTLTSGRPDVLILKLAGAITDIVPMSLSPDPKLQFGKLKAFVINEKSSTTGAEYILEERNCDLRRHQAFFPFDSGDDPDVLTVFGCKIISGNSGSPMVDSTGKVRAIVQAGAERGTSATTPQESSPFSQHETAVATNVGCLNFLSGNPNQCVVADHAEIDRRFANYQDQALKAVSSSPAVDFDAETGFRALAFQLKTPASEFGYSFEVAYIPDCRKLDQVLDHTSLAIRQVNLSFDDWANINTAIADEALPQAKVLGHQDELYELEVAWPPPFGELLEPNLDIRKQLGTRFSIALPICPR